MLHPAPKAPQLCDKHSSRSAKILVICSAMYYNLMFSLCDDARIALLLCVTINFAVPKIVRVGDASLTTRHAVCRYEKRHANLSAHISPCFRCSEGDTVVVGQCRRVQCLIEGAGSRGHAQHLDSANGAS